MQNTEISIINNNYLIPTKGIERLQEEINGSKIDLFLLKEMEKRVKKVQEGSVWKRDVTDWEIGEYILTGLFNCDTKKC